MKSITLLGFMAFSWLTVSAQEKIYSATQKIARTYDRHEIEIFKLNSRKIFRLQLGRTVWIQIIDSSGKRKLKKTRLVNLSEHEITLQPYDKALKTITYADSTIYFIGFTSVGRIIIAMATDILIAGTAIVGAVFVITGVVIQLALIPIMIFSRDHSLVQLYSFRWVGEAFRDIGALFKSMVPLKKKISLDGEKWGLRIVNK